MDAKENAPQKMKPVLIPEPLHATLKARSAQSGKKLNETVTEILQSHLEEHRFAVHQPA
jgi:predicted HicB family RNase H-like nuclease